MIAACAFATGLVWRGDQPYRIKAAGLLALSLLATPYAYIYDATLLATAIAFPLAHWLERGLDRVQATALLCASFLVLTFPAWGKPTGLLATLLIVALLWREARRGRGGLA